MADKDDRGAPDGTGQDGMTGEEMAEALFPKPSLPAEFFAHSFKLRILSVLSALGVAAVVNLTLNPSSEGGGPSPVAAAVITAIFGAAAVWMWRMAGDDRPALTVTHEGLEDRFYGFVPWEDVRAYRLVSSMFNPGFGYDLKAGVKPAERAGIFRFQKLMNKTSGLPARSFRKQMMAGGCDRILAACRAARPDLEGK